jgi:aryl-alcohol dehydrogenase-like predicted oxidoreductase
MGAALQGKRDQVFLMTKVCTHREGHHTREKAMAMIEESLKRLRTDRLDLWQIHAVSSEAEVEAIFETGGVLEAIEDAKKQGKIRYCGFTGHSSPDLHLRVLARRYPFDAVQLPLSVCDATAEGFQKRVLPELLKQGIAPLAMKSLGGNARMIRDGLVTAEEALRYVLSLPISSLISGIDSLEWLAMNARVAASFKPLSPGEMKTLEERCAGKWEYEPYRHWAYVDGERSDGQRLHLAHAR